MRIHVLRVLVPCLISASTLLLLASCGSSGSGSSGAQQTPAPGTPPSQPGPVSATLIKLSQDPYTSPDGQHETATEPSIASNGSTLVAAFHVARRTGGGAMNLGWATSKDGGTTWSRGVLSGTTVYAGGTYSNIYDPTVAYDAKHAIWMISAVVSGGAAVVVMRSPDGLSWQAPVVAHSGGTADKSWLSCDNNSGSTYFGNCYLEFDDENQHGLILLTRSRDGGQTWESAQSPSDAATGISGFPVIRPDGTVVVPTLTQAYDGMFAFHSTDGGASWSASTAISSVSFEPNRALLRVAPNPTAIVDATGKLTVMWIDCRFRPTCDANDIVMSTSSDGLTWSAVQKINLGLTEQGLSLIFPGIGINQQSLGTPGELGMVFYSVGGSDCVSTPESCRILAQYTTSRDGGASWSVPTVLSDPIDPAWVSTTASGTMIGDYTQVAFSNGVAFPVFSVALQPQSGLAYNQGIYTVPQRQ